jgi:hypothetical protein
MLKTLTPLFGALLLAATTALYAQTPAPADTGKGGHEKMKAAHKKARSACEGKQGQEHRDCMRKEMCAQSKDAAKCEAHFKERSAAFNKAYDSCKGKASGDEFRSCMREQRVREKK